LTLLLFAHRTRRPHIPTLFPYTTLFRSLDAVEARHVIPIVQDWGGPIGIGWATRYPERVAGVVVLNTWAFVREPPLQLPWLFKLDRKSTRLNSSHVSISYAVFCLKTNIV